MGKLFGTDGVRGVANKELTVELAYDLGQAGARVLSLENKHKPVILIGKDTRISCDMLEGALIAGMNSVGADVISVGVIPTPAIAYLTTKYKADAGVVISASHNSFEFNGIKFFNNAGYKLSDEIEDEIEEIIFNKLSDSFEKPIGKLVGRHYYNATAKEDYINHLIENNSIDLSGCRIALDCANGASFEVAQMLFEKLGATLSIIHNEPDGVNINHNCGSTHLENLIKHVVDTHSDIGFAFDGDADRLLAIDEKGNVIDGDAIMAIIAKDMLSKDKLPSKTLVVTVMSNMGLEIAAKREGFQLVRTAVGDRYVLEEMIRGGYTLGGEQSGHIICLDNNTTGDGLLSALLVMKILATGDKKPSEMAAIVHSLPQVIRNAKVSNQKKYDYLKDEIIAEKCKNLEDEFAGEGRVLIRPSGTEPLVRVMIEGADQQVLNQKADELVRIIEERLL